MSSPRWKHFGWRDVRAARAFAASGGIAVHENIFGKRWAHGPTAHLLGPDTATLIAAARALGLPPFFLQPGSREHFDLKGTALARALLLIQA